MNVNQMFLKRVEIIPGLFSMTIGKRTETEREREEERTQSGFLRDFKLRNKIHRIQEKKSDVFGISYNYIEKFVREN